MQSLETNYVGIWYANFVAFVRVYILIKIRKDGGPTVKYGVSIRVCENDSLFFFLERRDH